MTLAYPARELGMIELGLLLVSSSRIKHRRVALAALRTRLFAIASTPREILHPSVRCQATSLPPSTLISTAQRIVVFKKAGLVFNR
jgi:hypothetical protein